MASVRRVPGDTFTAIDSVKWRFDHENDASVLTVSGRGTVDWDDNGGGSKSLALPGGGFSAPSRRQRDPGQNQEAPFYNEPEFVCHVTTVRLPSDTSDEEWSFNRWYWNTMFGRLYYRGMRRQDGTIRLVRGSLVGTGRGSGDAVPVGGSCESTRACATCSSSRWRGS